MTTVDFVPNALRPFQFRAAFDGTSYTLYVSWNLFRQDYYILCRTLTGALVFNLPLIGSPPDYDINLLGGYFTTTTMVYRVASRQFEIGP